MHTKKQQKYDSKKATGSNVEITHTAHTQKKKKMEKFRWLVQHETDREEHMYTLVDLYFQCYQDFYCSLPNIRAN